MLGTRVLSWFDFAAAMATHGKELSWQGGEKLSEERKNEGDVGMDGDWGWVGAVYIGEFDYQVIAPS